MNQRQLLQKLQQFKSKRINLLSGKLTTITLT